MDAKLADKSEAERDLIRTQTQPEILKQLSEQKEDEDARWVLSLYEAAHRPIAIGRIPLTVQAVEAYAEWIFFVVGEAGGIRDKPDQQLKGELANYFAATYKNFTPEQQEGLAKMPTYWAALRVSWAQMSEAERNNLRREWVKGLAPLIAAQRKQSEGLKALGELEALLQKKEFNNEELLTIADKMKIVASELRQEGGEHNVAMADQLMQACSNIWQFVQRRQATDTSNASSDGRDAWTRYKSGHFGVASYSNLMRMNMSIYKGISPW